jgi:hypothetical protein
MASWDETATNQAAEFGWSLSVINSNPELKKLFASAKKENWTTAYFVAKVRDTKWFKTHSDSFRQAFILQQSDPATYKQNVAAVAAQITSMASQLGVTNLSATQLNSLATQAYQFGWNADQVRQHVSGLLRPNAAGGFSGDAGTAQFHYNQLIAQYGVKVPESTIATWVKKSLTGELNDEVVQKYLVGLASSKYPPLADRLKAGETLMDIASPYMNSYAQILEINPNTISLNDNLIQQALSAKDQEGKPTTKTVWEFEQELRNDPRYMKTQQAQDKTMAVGHQVLRDMGLLGS